MSSFRTLDQIGDIRVLRDFSKGHHSLVEGKAGELFQRLSWSHEDGHVRPF